MIVVWANFKKHYHNEVRNLFTSTILFVATKLDRSLHLVPSLVFVGKARASPSEDLKNLPGTPL
jgi:hypothetical protein